MHTREIIIKTKNIKRYFIYRLSMIGGSIKDTWVIERAEAKICKHTSLVKGYREWMKLDLLSLIR